MSDVFNKNTIIAASDAFPNVTGKVFLGRPWGGTSHPTYRVSVIDYGIDYAK